MFQLWPQIPELSRTQKVKERVEARFFLRAFEVCKRLGGYPMKMTTHTRQVAGITIVDISGRIVLGEESATLRNLVCDLLSQGHGKILFNLADVNYIDSSGLGHLV